MSAKDIALKLREKFGELVAEPSEFRGEITVVVNDAERVKFTNVRTVGGFKPQYVIANSSDIVH